MKCPVSQSRRGRLWDRAAVQRPCPPGSRWQQARPRAVGSQSRPHPDLHKRTLETAQGRGPGAALGPEDTGLRSRDGQRGGTSPQASEGPAGLPRDTRPECPSSQAACSGSLPRWDWPPKACSPRRTNSFTSSRSRDSRSGHELIPNRQLPPGSRAAVLTPPRA